jgi:hypothetical protein
MRADPTIAAKKKNPDAHEGAAGVAKEYFRKIEAPCDPQTVNQFLAIVSEHAMRACADIEGFLQISKVSPVDDKLIVSGRFKPDDVEHMVEAAIADAAGGFNSYIEARLVTGATAGKRGNASHSAGVFALVIDNDADTGKASTSILPPSMRIETSPGNRHDWYFLERAITAKAASEIGTTMRHHTGTDQDTGVPTQPYRIAGTPNFPGRSKQARGRFEVHPTRILEYSGKIYTADELRAAFPQPKKDKSRSEDKADDNVDWRFAEENLPADLRHLIQHGVEVGHRSEQFHHVVGWLKRLGWNAENICSLLGNYPEGIASKYGNRLAPEVQRSFDKRDDPPPQEEEGKEEEDDDDLATMNAAYAVVKVGGKTRVVEFEESTTYPGCGVPVFATISDFCAFHAKKKKSVPAGNGTKEIGIGRWWIDHAGRRQYDRVAYLPGITDPNVLNLWRGFAFVPKPGKCELYLAHLYENVCRKNQDHFDYLLNWKADAVQRPGRRCEVAIVLRGKEGTGKGIAIVYFGRLFGSHYRYIAQSKHLTGHFNSHLLHCSVLHADEAFFAGDRSNEGVLKALITEPTILIEPKGIDPFAIPNCLHIIMSSNSDWVIPASAEARRYAVFDVDPVHMQDRPYFAAIVNEMENGGQEALLHLLQNRDLSHFDIRAVPQTGALAEQKAHSRRGIDRLVEILAHDGILPCADASDPAIAITTGEGKGEGFYPAARTLSPDLKHQSSQIIAVSLHKDWGCSPWKSGYQRGIKFPPLLELRDRFDQRHGKQNWPVEHGPIEWGG